MQYDISEKFLEAEFKIIRAGLTEHNKKFVSYGVQYVQVFARDENCEVVGGLHSTIVWDWLHVDILWVHESHRGKGVASRLLREELIAKGVKMYEPMIFGDLVLCDGDDPEGNPFQISNRKRDGSTPKT